MSINTKCLNSINRYSEQPTAIRRQCIDKHVPTIILLKASSVFLDCYRNLIQALSDRFHLIGPDYPGFAMSDHPAVGSFSYTFDHLSEVNAINLR